MAKCIWHDCQNDADPYVEGVSGPFDGDLCTYHDEYPIMCEMCGGQTNLPHEEHLSTSKGIVVQWSCFRKIMESVKTDA